MSRLFRRAAMIAIAAYLAPAIAGDRNSPTGPIVTLRHDPQFILEVVAQRMGVVLRLEIPVPAILLGSRTSLRQFQHAMKTQWPIRPHVITNAYAIARNEIYLADGASYYLRLNRTLDDSLAHEFAHYIQARYFGDDLASDSSEAHAVAIQMSFREVYMRSSGWKTSHLNPTGRQAP